MTRRRRYGVARFRERLRGAVEAWLLRIWFGPATAVDRIFAALAAPVGLPLSWLVAAVARRRRRSIVKQTAAAGTAPVVVVGNLVAGGSGKTPLVAAIARALVGAGFHPGLLAAGYRSRPARGSHSAGAGVGARGKAGDEAGSGADGEPTLVDASSDASAVGDEALLLVQETGLPLAVGRDRGAAADLLRRSHPECDVIISDDGLQHVGLVRQLELLLIDDRGFGNGRCLPAGPLREPVDRLDSVDAVVFTSAQASVAPGHGTQFRSLLEMTRFRTLDGASSWLPRDFVRDFAGQPLAAIAGIARPERFFSSLASLGLQPGCHPLPDHAEIEETWLAALPGRWILMTGKDAVKCRRFAAPLRQRLVCVDVAAAPDAALLKWLAVRLRPAAHRNG